MKTTVVLNKYRLVYNSIFLKTVCCIQKYSTQQVQTAVHPPTYLYMLCSYMKSNSVLVADGNTTSSAVSPRRRGARPKYVWTAESPTKRVYILARLPNNNNHRRGYIKNTRAWPLP